MKTSAWIAVALLTVGLPLGLAAQTEEQHEAPYPEAAGATLEVPVPVTPMPTEGGQAAVSTQAPAVQPLTATAPPQAPATSATPLQTLTQQMREQMEQIRQTADPAERQRLLQEHLRSMQDTMWILEGMLEAQAALAPPQAGMMGQGMMGGMRGRGGMGGGMMRRMMHGEEGGETRGHGRMGRESERGHCRGGDRGDHDEEGEMRGHGRMGKESAGGHRGGGGRRGGMMEQQGEAVQNRLDLIEKRLNGLQMLLDQMLQHQAFTQGQG